MNKYLWIIPDTLVIIKLIMKKAFTLIELLVVVAIISLLSSVIYASVGQAREKGQDAKAKQEVNSVRTALQLYEDANGTMPLAFGASTATIYDENDEEYFSSLGMLVEDGYISEVPTSPNDTPYVYGVSSDGYAAVFGAGLNNDTGFGSSRRNTCNFILDEEIDNGEAAVATSCTPYGTSYYEENCELNYPYVEGCADIIHNPDYSNINPPISEFVHYCGCQYEGGGVYTYTSSNEAKAPSKACEQVFSGCDPLPYLNGYDYWTAIFVCDYPEVSGPQPVLCDGTKDNDFCACVE